MSFEKFIDVFESNLISSIGISRRMLVWVRFGLDLDDVIIAAEESPKGISRVWECEGISLGEFLINN